MFSHLLVPLDGSRFAEAAVPYALSLAGQYGARVTLLRVVSPSLWESMMEVEAPDLYDTIAAAALKDARSYMADQTEKMTGGDISVICQVEQSEDSTAEAILSVAADEQADLSVMSTHGRSGLERWMFGSVAERVVRYSALPVMVIRPPEDENGGG